MKLGKKYTLVYIHHACLVCSKVGQLEVEVLVKDAVLRFDVSVVDPSLVKIDDGQGGLCEVMRGQGLREVTHSVSKSVHEVNICHSLNVMVC